MELLTGSKARLLPHLGCLHMLLFDLSVVFCFGGVLSGDHRCLCVCDDSGSSIPCRADYELCQKLIYRVLQNPIVHAANIAKNQALQAFWDLKDLVRESAVLQYSLSCEVSKAFKNLPASARFGALKPQSAKVYTVIITTCANISHTANRQSS